MMRMTATRRIMATDQNRGTKPEIQMEPDRTSTEQGAPQMLQYEAYADTARRSTFPVRTVAGILAAGFAIVALAGPFPFAWSFAVAFGLTAAGVKRRQKQRRR